MKLDAGLPERQTQAARIDQQFADAGFTMYAEHGSMRCYKKCPQKTADGGEVAIRVEPKGNGGFTVFTRYEKNYIIYARRSHTAAADSADETLAAVAKFEKYLLLDTMRAVEQAALTPRLWMR
jgi:hypothetical protein